MVQLFSRGREKAFGNDASEEHTALFLQLRQAVLRAVIGLALIIAAVLFPLYLAGGPFALLESPTTMRPCCR